VQRSLITVATVGYGDIVPKSNAAKLLVMSEILIGIAHSVLFFSIGGD
jgi:hypothetical protein